MTQPAARLVFLVLLISSLTSETVAEQSNALTIPPSLSGTEFTLNVAPSTHVFFAGTQTNTYGVNGSYLAPTLILNQGERIRMHVVNALEQETTMHWHGMHVAPENDGGPHSVIAPGTTWSPEFEVMDRATTFWYHPHLHEHTNEQVYRGVAGMIIVRDPVEAALDLPRTYGVDDIPVIVQDRTFSPQNQLVFNPGGAGAGGNTIIVNGTVAPFAEVGANLVRLRLLNGSGARVYQFGFSDNRSFHMIGSDGGLLSAPVEMNRLRLAAGERAEIVVDFSADAGASAMLMSWSSELTRGEPGGVRQAGGPPPPPNSIDGTDFDILEFRVGEASEGAVFALPGSLAIVEPVNEIEADRTRTILLNTTGGPGTPLAINGALMDLDVINEVVTLGDTEIWELRNQTNIPHPFHIHDIQFYILDRNGEAPPEHEAGRKDVVLVYPDETVRFITTFDDFANPDVPYMYHCHFLGHEDGGMMGQFIVVDPLSTATEAPLLPVSSGLAVYPNPFSERVRIRYQMDVRAMVEVAVYDSQGRRVQGVFAGERAPGVFETVWIPSGMVSGTYFVRIQRDGVSATEPIVLTR